MSDTVALIGGYVVVAAIVVQWPVVVRDRKRGLVALHTLALAAVIGAWQHKGFPLPAVVNGLWLVLSLAWYVAGRRTAAGRALDPPRPLDSPDDEPGASASG